jgi:hypothetical protein
MTFDPSKDGADRCEAFCAAFVALLREHQVKITGKFRDLQQVRLEHDGGDPENGWLLDMQDMAMLANGEKR